MAPRAPRGGLLPLMLLLAGFAVRRASCEVSFAVVHFNDVHGRVDPSGAEFQGRCSDEELEAGACRGGFGKVATVVRRERERGDVLVLDAGDEFMGTIWTNVHRGMATASFQNALGVDAMALGNHEFDFGPPDLGVYIDRLEFPVLGANIDASMEPALAGKIANSTRVEVAGVTVGVVGFISTDTPFQSSPGESVVFLTDLTAVVQGEIDRLREDNVTIIIGLSHLGFNLDRRLVQTLSGLDVLVGGHSHTRLVGDDYPTFEEDKEGVKVPVVTAYWATQYVGVLNVVFSDDGELLSAEGEAVVLGGNRTDLETFVEDDPDMIDLIAMYRGDVDGFRNLQIGVSNVFLDGEPESVRSNATNLGILLCDAMVLAAKGGTDFEKEFGNIDVCIQNSGGIMASIDVGGVKYEEIIATLPFGNVLAVVRLSPAQIYLALENGVRRWANGTGAEEFPQVAGIRFAFCEEKAEGEKVLMVDVFDGENFVSIARDDEEPSINVATNNFLVHGGDNYTMLEDAEQLTPFGATLDFLMFDYVEKFTPLEPEVDDRIRHDCSTV